MQGKRTKEVIEFNDLFIRDLNDYDKLFDMINDDAIDNQVVDTVKRFLGLKCDRIVIEYPYHDKDFLSTYYCYYSQKFRGFSKKCYRLHVMGENDEYYGYIVLRPTVKGTRLGTTYLSPKALVDEDAYLMIAGFEAHIMGDKQKIMCFPWMKQEVDISVCAHVAAWTILRYYGTKYHNYADTTMGTITQRIKGDMGRKTPSSGLTPVQIADLFQEYGFSPIIRGGMKEKNNRLLDEMVAYIESGIPIVGFISPKQHAVSIVGHGKLDYELLDDSVSINKLKDYKTGVVLHSKLVSSLYVMEDNYFAYRKVSKDLPTSSSDVDYNLYEIKFAVIPLYEKMQLVYNEVYERYTALVESDTMDWEEIKVSRIYMTSTNSLKREAGNNDMMCDELKIIISRLNMSKFVWCIDIAGIDNYKRNLTSGRIIIDSTCSTYEKEPWLLMHDGHQIKYYDEDENQNYVVECEVQPYTIYMNNLKKV
ncbi:hypothetical protein [Anaerosporobacter sp.]|uniref:hypothetical protein n=1 Tax=Anaerosporobacter sp. TaxID=1872529 RepID=UPI00286F1B0C|nr:hypothetical protein [Anaerosporobacter sp.]